MSPAVPRTRPQVLGVLGEHPQGVHEAGDVAEDGEQHADQQVRGEAGDHQVDGAKTAMGHAYGGGAQFYSMWIVSSEKH